MFCFEAFYVFLFYQRANSLRCFVEKISHINDTRFAAELPRFDFVRVSQAQRSGFLAVEFWSGDGMRRDVELSSRIAVDQQHVDVVGTLWPDRALMRDLKSRKRR